MKLALIHSCLLWHMLSWSHVLLTSYPTSSKNGIVCINLFSYIRHYTTIDENAEIPFVNFQSALQILMDLIPESPPKESRHIPPPEQPTTQPTMAVRSTQSAPDTASPPVNRTGSYYGNQYKLRANTIKTLSSIANTYKQRNQQQRQEAEKKFNNKANQIRDKFKFTDERFYYSNNDPRMHLRASEIEEVISQLEPLSPRTSGRHQKTTTPLEVQDIAY